MKILIVGSNSILSKAILIEHQSDQVDMIYHDKPTDYYSNLIHISKLNELGDNYDLVYLVSAIIRNNVDDTELLFDVNVKLIQTISNLFKSARLIYFSTVAVYDALESGFIDEKTKASPCSFYGISKLWGERIVSQHKKYTIIRISSLYGEGMKQTTFLPIIIKDALTKGRITLLGDGSRKQNYISVSDVAVLAKKLALMDQNMLQLAVGEFSYSNKQIAEILQNILSCEIIYSGFDNTRSVEYNQNTIPYDEYNLVNIEKGIKTLITWIKEQY